jgi:hypothetical protein
MVTEKLRWVHGGKAQVAQQDRVKTTMTGPDTWFLQPIKFQVLGTTLNTNVEHKHSQSRIVTEELR